MFPRSQLKPEQVKQVLTIASSNRLPVDGWLKLYLSVI
jgi:hypothetical protein